MVWVRALTEQVVETLKVPRKAYDEVAANEEGWRSLREDLSQGLFVDMNRLMVVAA
jgi:hypothetical protein